MAFHVGLPPERREPVGVRRRPAQVEQALADCADGSDHLRKAVQHGTAKKCERIAEGFHLPRNFKNLFKDLRVLISRLVHGPCGQPFREKRRIFFPRVGCSTSTKRTTMPTGHQSKSSAR